MPVCYSITHQPGDPPNVNRKCDETGEVVRVPGDLAVPPDFGQSYERQCKEQGPGIEVKLKGARPDDGRKRYIHCGEIFLLGALRKQLINLGVEDDASTVAHPASVTTLRALNRRYTGTADGFAAEFPGFLQRAADAMGLQPKDYTKATEFIIGAVRTCAQITPEMYRSLMARKLGDQYKACNASTRLVSDQANLLNTRGLVLEISGVGNFGNPEGGRAFGVEVCSVI